jgi:hypothetical protein
VVVVVGTPAAPGRGYEGAAASRHTLPPPSGSSRYSQALGTAHLLQLKR